ncbi:MAG: UbiX family flavin prenyltransferase [Rhodospirillales bacterium]|jgi:4-hydroxy-3-polyprenylbenzoate decarboxylase
MANRQRLIIGITGASGPIIGIRALEVLQDVPDVETHLIFSPAAAQTIAAETNFSLDDVRGFADVVHSFKDIAASISSGSFQTLGMLVAPCSIKTLSYIVNSLTDNLIARAADVCLKERRKVVLMVRETPLHLGHIELMSRATQYGAVMMPPMPAFYHRPQTVDDIVDQTVGRALDQFGIDTDIVHRWRGTQSAAAGNL